MSATSTGRRERRPAPPRRRIPLFAFLIGAVAVLGVVAIVLATVGGDDDTTDDPPSGSLPEFDAGADEDPAVGLQAPTLEGENFDGVAITIGDDGTAKAVMFLAHWCPHCQAEAARLGDWLAENDLPDSVELYLVATATSESRDNYPPKEWLEREGLGDVPTLADDDAFSAYRTYGAGAFPYTVFIDADNEVALRTSGEYPDDPDVYTTLFDDMAAGRQPESPQAGPSSGG
jgi:cytochrome c biogenesis protein CcmG/thiol:disulfide interchange protein DsbE